MTQETRETPERVLRGLDLLRQHVANHEAHTNACAADPDGGHCDCGGIRLRDLIDAIRADVASLRDVLTPRTCAGCKSRHEITGACYKDVQDPEGEEVTNTRSPWNWRNRDTFGCSEWKPRQAREGEGGEG